MRPLCWIHPGCRRFAGFRHGQACDTAAQSPALRAMTIALLIALAGSLALMAVIVKRLDKAA
jgi:hypothetical protein